ncbi:MAG: SMC-Scp complex subunit ScpB [Bacteroidota bacterium]
MELSIIIPHIEALVFASEKPLTPLEVVELVNNALGFIEDRATLDQVESAVEAIKEKYNSEFYPFELKQSGGGLQFLTKAAYHKTVAQLNGDKYLKRLSTAALETLAIIAYKQPITKGEIESLRGVNCDYAVQKLLEKDLVLITGRKENAPGQPLIYGTSKTFMDYFGINSADELPKLSDIVGSDIVNSTTVGEANPVDGDMIAEDKTLVVDENGNIEELLENAEPAEGSAEVFTGNSNEEAEIVVEELSTETITVETESGLEEEVHSEDLAEDKTEEEEKKEDKQEDDEQHPEQP